MRPVPDGTFSGFWTILLLVLALSPVTAAFSSCDLEPLVSDREARGAILQPSAVQDKPVNGLIGLIVPDVRPQARLEPCVSGAPAPVQGCTMRRFPLRI